MATGIIRVGVAMIQAQVAEGNVMWIFTTHGFFSAVCARQGDGSKSQPVDPDRIMVRARVRQHLLNLIKAYPAELSACEISESKQTDYAFRFFVAKDNWSDVLANLARETDYDNFKSAVGREQGPAGNAYLHALHDVWEVMYKLQK